jgi:hypothetical protein
LRGEFGGYFSQLGGYLLTGAFAFDWLGFHGS